jgi:uncharacterized protein
VVLNFTPYIEILQRFPAVPACARLEKWIGASDRKHFAGRDLLHALAGGGLTASVVSPKLVSCGYAYLMVDVRRTGTSTGKWDFFGQSEQQDYLEVLRCACEQPWCKGNLAATGACYGALVALTIGGLQRDGSEHPRSSGSRASCARGNLPVVSRRRTSPSGSARECPQLDPFDRRPDKDGHPAAVPA